MGLARPMWDQPIEHFCLWTGTFPFGDPDEANGKNGVQTMIARIMKVDITPLPEPLSPELKDLLKCILIADPTKRPSIQQVMLMRDTTNMQREII